MGRIVGPFGVQGWIKVKPFTELPDALGRFDAWVVWAPEGWQVRSLEGFELHSKGPVGKIAGCDDRDAAERLRERDVAVPRQALGEAEQGTWFQVDLVGLEVVEEGGGVLGRVESFFETGQTSVMVVRGERERMIPFVPGFVKSVDREARRITVDWKPDYDA